MNKPDPIACERLKKATSLVMFRFPLEGHILGKIPVYALAGSSEPKNTETAFACDKGLFFYDTFILDITQDNTQHSIGMRRLYFLILHEIRHWIYMHVFRWKEFGNTLALQKQIKDSRLFNIAADYVINGELVSDYADIDITFRPEFIESGIIDKEGKYDGLSTEQVYIALLNDLPEPPQNGSSQNANAGQEGQQDNLDIHDLREPTPEELEQAQIVANESAKGSSMDTKEIRDTILTATQIAKMQGNAPASIDRMIASIVETKTSWEASLRRYMRAFEKADFNFSRPNRRYMSQGLILPSAGKKQKLKHVVLAMDTSGSIGSHELTAFASETRTLLQQCHIEQLTIIYADTEVANVQVFKRPRPQDTLKLAPAGGGGTDFVPVFDYVMQQSINPDVLIYFTDTYGRFPNAKDVKFNTIWAIPPYVKNVDLPFGKKLIVDLEADYA